MVLHFHINSNQEKYGKSMVFKKNICKRNSQVCKLQEITFKAW